MILFHETEGLVILLQFLSECLRVRLAHPAAEDVEGVVLILRAGRKFSHIKVL